MDIVAEIDAALGCQQCGDSLEGSVDVDFCSEACQRTWRAARVGVRPDLPFTLDTDAVMSGADLRQFVDALRTQLGVDEVNARAADDDGIRRGLAEIREMSEHGVHSTVEQIMDAVVQINAMFDHASTAGRPTL